MKKSWLKNSLEDADKDSFRSEYRGSKIVRERLTELLREKIDASERNAESKDSYETPNWAFSQADSIGYKRALKEIIDLISD